ncbi:MAG: SIR2 family NAD-dependent protein deacylase [Nitriliruptoraceae bacterium]
MTDREATIEGGVAQDDGDRARPSTDVLDELASRLTSIERPAVVLSGAGISVSSDIPAFRGSGGLWARYDPMEYATIEAFRADPDKVWQMLWELDAVLEAAEPNPAHLAIAELQALGVVATVVTQNIDGLHQRAGSDDVVELHGSRSSLTCLDCGWTQTREVVAAGRRGGGAPRCDACDGALKPDAVFFGEPLPVAAWQRAEQRVRDALDVLVVGTAAEVEPAASLPYLAGSAGARVWEINPEPSLPIARHIPRPAEAVLPELVSRLRERRSGADHGSPG